MSSEASFSCELPTEVPVAEFKVEIEKPSFEGEDLTDNEGSLTLGTIIDGSTTEALEFGSEVVVYLEHTIPTGFTVSFASDMLKTTICRQLWTPVRSSITTHAVQTRTRAHQLLCKLFQFDIS